MGFPLWHLFFLCLCLLYGTRGFHIFTVPNFFNYNYWTTIQVPVAAPPGAYYLRGNPFHRDTVQSFVYALAPPAVIYSLFPNLVTLKQDGNSRTPIRIIFEDIGVSNISHFPPTCGRLSTGRARHAVFETLSQKRFTKGTTTIAAKEFLTSLKYNGPNTNNSLFAKSIGPHRIVNTKITFGEVASMNEAPWQVAMFSKGRFHCGASIISEIHILTAAHCVTAFVSRVDALDLILGDWDLKSKTDGIPVTAEIDKIITHPNFSFFTLQSDIALVKLKKKIVFSSRIRPVCLPSKGLKVKGELITVTGWGRNENNILQTKLNKLTAIVLENNLCADRWSLSGAPRSLIGDGTLCMDTQLGDSCKGDSGGPAIIENPKEAGVHIQVGIVSFGSGSCTDTQLPGVYTRVTSYINWIAEKMKE